MNKDYYWKGILDDFAAEAILFFFPNSDKIFNLKKIKSLDKELAEIIPNYDGDNPNSTYVDKLFSVPYLDTTKGDEWILMHFEVQGQWQSFFPKRAFEYNITLKFRHNKEVVTLVIFTDDNPNWKPHTYEYGILGTKTTFVFPYYKVLDQDEEELKQNPNPMAVVMLTTLLQLKNKRSKHPMLLDDLHAQLVRNLLERKMPKAKIRVLLLFIKHVTTTSVEERHIFDKNFNSNNLKLGNMGLFELELTVTRQELKAAQEKAEKAEHHQRANRKTAQYFLKNGHSIEGIAEIMELSIAEITALFAEK